MLINGKERKFKYTVGAEIKITEVLCPEKDYADIKSLIQEPDSKKSFANHFMLAVILNQQYELSRKLSDPKYKILPEIKLEEVEDLSIPEMDQLQIEIYQAIADGGRKTVEIKSQKTGKKKAKKSS